MVERVTQETRRESARVTVEGRAGDSAGSKSAISVSNARQAGKASLWSRLELRELSDRGRGGAGAVAAGRLMRWGRRGECGRGAAGRACSCDRVGGPAPGAHPLSPVWKLQATVDPAVIGHWWS